MARASCDGAKPPVSQTTPIVNNEIENAEKWLLATGLYRLFRLFHAKSNLLQMRFGILRRSAGFLSISSKDINNSPDTFSAALFLQNFQQLENDHFSFVLTGELFNLEIHNDLGFNIFLSI